ncbi:PXA-domain-containing protein [Gonapodya prolifera JEL478]|uniref:PXA-domain-containing protein n=1 Tax=Gonapodya prolifera (strain JEL478) TaxID=1344416 RepID=A0A139AIX6_GONPJ|nr:PXA-domain-containing protein [Gonapodya prolifera JEL478]|eukprot:KXS16740.1 PXA-domain-containing protein [Gonapodya prolifera JEL478]
MHTAPSSTQQQTPGSVPRRLQSVQAAFEYFCRTINPPPFTSLGSQRAQTEQNDSKSEAMDPRPIGEDVNQRRARTHSILDVQLQALTFLVIRDFVQGWYYAHISTDDEFMKEVVRAIARVARELESRFEKVDFIQLFTLDLPRVLSNHLADYRLARRRSETLYAGALSTEDVFDALQPHFAMRGPAAEQSYLSGVADLLVTSLLPRRDAESDSVRYILREIISGKLVTRALDSLCDPETINDIIQKCFNVSDGPSPQAFPFSDTETSTNRFNPGADPPPTTGTAHMTNTTPISTTDSVVRASAGVKSQTSLLEKGPQSSLLRSISTTFPRPTSGVIRKATAAELTASENVGESEPAVQPTIQFVHPPRPSTPEPSSSPLQFFADLIPRFLHTIGAVGNASAAYLILPIAAHGKSAASNLFAILGLASFLVSKIRRGLTDAGVLSPTENAVEVPEDKIQIKRWRAGRLIPGLRQSSQEQVPNLLITPAYRNSSLHLTTEIHHGASPPRHLDSFLGSRWDAAPRNGEGSGSSPFTQLFVPNERRQILPADDVFQFDEPSSLSVPPSALLSPSLPGAWVDVPVVHSEEGSPLVLPAISEQIQALIADYRTLVDGEAFGPLDVKEESAYSYAERCQRDELRYTDSRLEKSWLEFLGEVVEWREKGWWVWNQVMFFVVPMVRWVFGKGLNRLIIRSVHRALSERTAALIIRSIRMGVWPGGRLADRKDAIKRTEREKSELRLRVRDLMREKIPAAISTVLGPTLTECCIDDIHGSLQNARINRHLVFVVIDIILRYLFPEEV